MKRGRETEGERTEAKGVRKRRESNGEKNEMKVGFWNVAGLTNKDRNFWKL